MRRWPVSFEERIKTLPPLRPFQVYLKPIKPPCIWQDIFAKHVYANIQEKKPFSHLLNDKIQMKHFLLTIHYLAHQDNVITRLRSHAGRRFAFNTTPTPPSAYRVLCSGLKYPIICSFFGLNAKLINRYQLQKYAEFTYFPYVEVESSTTRMMFFFQDLSAILTFYFVVRGEFV